MAKRPRIQSRVNDIVTRYVDQMVLALSAEIRRSVADEIRQHFAKGGTAARGAAPALRRRRKRIRPCIAPGCTNPSKGPRFHYLCDKHRGAPKKDYEAWRKAKREKQAAA